LVKHFAIYDQGSSLYREDGLIVGIQLFGVIDGVSAPYSPKYPTQKFYGLSGGEMVARLCERVTRMSPRSMDIPIDLRQFILFNLNDKIGDEQEIEGVSRNDAGNLAGAAFAFAHVTETHINLAQTGDCMVVVELKNGDIVVSPNQVRAHDQEMHEHIERIQREVAQEMFGLALEDVPEDKQGQVRGEMWDRFHPILLDARRRNVNRHESPNGYGFLNGQIEFVKRWWEFMWERTFSLEDVATILLFSDGMTPWPIMKSSDDEEIGRTILTEFKYRGLAGVLLSARGIEEQTAATSHTNQAEATAVVLVF